MFNFGDKVVVLDKTLKSYKKVGLYCGQNDKGLAKIYLKEPIKNEKSKNNVHCITITEEKISLYCENNKEAIKNRLDYLYRRLKEIKQEEEDLENEIFELENELLLN